MKKGEKFPEKSSREFFAPSSSCREIEFFVLLPFLECDAHFELQ